MKRRTFLKVSGIVGGGLIAGIYLTRSPAKPALASAEGTFTPNAFLQITRSNDIRFYCPRDEMGQGVTTGLTTLIAEELDIAPDSIEVVLAGAHEDYNNPEFGLQLTGGSTSIRTHYQQLRQLAANVRASILQAAAQKLSVNQSQLTTYNAQVGYAGQQYPYGDFVDIAASATMPETAPLKDANQFRYIGKEFPRLDGMEKSTGTAIYGIDADLPGLHYAATKRAPVAGAVVLSYDDSNAKAVIGVTDIIKLDSSVAVVADRYWSAKKAAQLLNVKWSQPTLASVSTATLKNDYAEAMANEEGVEKALKGDLVKGFDDAKHIIESEYWTPFLSHSPMEPMNATVRIGNGKAEVWTGHQGAGICAGFVARYADLNVEDVTVHSTYMGGAFGRRAFLNHVAEATQIAVASGKPTKLVWSREEDTQNGYYRPASLMKVKAGTDANGKITAWQVKRIGGNITPTTLKEALPGIMPGVPEGLIDWAAGMSKAVFDSWSIDESSVEGLFEDYDFPNRQVNHVSVEHGIPLAFWRSVGHSYTAFAKETAIDELAIQGGFDPVAFRLLNTQNNPKLANVISLMNQKVAELGTETGRAWGVAAHDSFHSSVAEAAEVSVEGNQIKVHRVVCAIDCGRAVNPDIVRAQMEGAVMFGLTAALHGNLDLDNGAIKQSNFHDYPILRMNESPAVEVIIVESEQPPTGVGEPGLPPIAPAVANAVFNATGQRLRSLPLKLT